VAGSGTRLRNRPPDRKEIATDRHWLDAELAIISPRVVVCLGAVAAGALIGPRFRLGESRGEPVTGVADWIIVPTYHPSYPLRLVGESFDRVFGAIVGDLRRARELAEGAGRARPAPAD
jgi:DNA polymerase